MEIITQSEALNCRLSRYFTGRPCKYGHISERYISGLCVQCAKERVRKRNKDVTGIRRAIWKKSDGHCWYCGFLLPEDCRQYHIDHIIPPRNGGADDISNLVPSCGACNNAKHVRTLEEFRLVRARQASGYPLFNKQQIQWLKSMGFEFPPLPDHRFWFEEQGL